MFLQAVAPLLVLLAVARAGVPGGPAEVDLEREDVQNALQFAVAQHNKANNDVFLSQVSRVMKAETQVVSGINYIFTVEMARTACRKDGVKSVCEIAVTEQPRECQFKVWSQPWTSTIKLLENTCKE